MEALEAIKTRRSVRRFSPKDVEESKLSVILDAGRLAPSGLNNQPWRFIIVRDKKTKEVLSGQSVYPDMIRQSSVSIVVYLDSSASYDTTKDVQAIGACIQNMLLAVHDLGLGACWIGDLLKNRETIDRIFNVPETYELMAVVAVGYPAAKAGSKPDRKELDELIYSKWI